MTVQTDTLRRRPGEEPQVFLAFSLRIRQPRGSLLLSQPRVYLGRLIGDVIASCSLPWLYTATEISTHLCILLPMACGFESATRRNHNSGTSTDA
ncbi:hypothetical protein C8Q80DRAFT_68284 [Daedaleopsis nitida]|nr:hypothetical protein C8Q80DRAFT_68284 [Daedaleopsis nitida]